MNTFGLVIGVIIAFLLYGVIATLATFVALAFWAGGWDIETILWVTSITGLLIGILGAAVPALRRAGIFVLTLFAPSSW